VNAMDIGRVKSDTGLNLRVKPNGEKIAVLRHNEEVEILDEVSFFRVMTPNGRIGFVHGSFLEKMPELDNDLRILSNENAFPSELFNVVKFSNENFVGEAIRIDSDFVNALTRVGQIAKGCNLKVWVTSSLRSINNQVRGAIVSPATNSCHHIGHAIDMNLLHNGILYNSKKLKRNNLRNSPDPIQKFIDLIRVDKELRWGGDFNTEDPVHIDDDFFRKQKIFYKAKLHSRLDQLNA